MDACLQVKARGYRVLFDFANVLEHRPNNTAYDGKREGDLAIKVDNAAYNAGFVLGKHTPARLRPWRLLYLLAVGSTATPGLVAYPMAVRRYRRPFRELTVLGRAMRNHLAGWARGIGRGGGKDPRLGRPRRRVAASPSGESSSTARPTSLRRSAAECLPGRSAALSPEPRERRGAHSAAERRNEGQDVARG